MRKLQKMLMRLLMLPLINFSACSTLPPRPDSYICVMNALGHHRKCFHMQRDFDREGNLLPNAVPLYQVTTSLDDLDKDIIFDDESFANVKAYLELLRRR